MRRVAVAVAALVLAAPALADRGRELYENACAKCHGGRGQGLSALGARHGLGPSLVGAGAQAADFYLRTGYMPLDDPSSQPRRGKPRYSERDIRALVAYVASLGRGPAVPRPHPERGSLAEGMELFTQDCAGCHQIAGKGGVVTGAVAPALDDATPIQIAEAVRIGPYLMPRFSRRQLSDRELDSIVRYVEQAKRPLDRGGWGIGHVGPVPEGIVTWLIAVAALLAVSMAIGKRLR